VYLLFRHRAIVIQEIRYIITRCFNRRNIKQVGSDKKPLHPVGIKMTVVNDDN
jgi:hypothetical protein